MNRSSQSFRASEAAWLLQALCAQGSRVLRHGWCVGELRADDLEFANGIVQRSRNRGVVNALRNYAKMRHHRKRGHDRACVTVGVPLGTLRTLATAWAGKDASELLLDALNDAFAQIEAGEWQCEEVSEAVKHVIGRRITLRAPTDHSREGAKPTQIPRFASKLPSSRRALTWPKKRAASAPSMTR